MTIPQLDNVHIGLITAVLGKGFIMAARSMPPLAPGARYFTRWFHDFLQMAASNPDKVGETKVVESKAPQPVTEVAQPRAE